MLATPLIVGAVSKAPHPEAAKLFVDWAMSKRGQAWYQTNPNLYYGSVRTDAPPMPTGVRLGDLKLLYPADWDDYAANAMSFPRNGTACSACERSGRAIREVASLRAANGWVWGRGGCRGPGPVPGLLSVQAALDVGDPQVRPPTAYGFDNFSGILQYPQILLNTLTVSLPPP